MPITLRLVRVFLASPGDLSAERSAAFEAAEDVNVMVARPKGYQIDLIGWEDTLPGTGRPQAIINEEIRTCELFIGMLGARWGTPPGEGNFTSGFEEEFTLARELHRGASSPEIKMFLKDIPADRSTDPGPELQKVLAFRQQLIDEKAILYQTFNDEHALAGRVRRCLADYVNKLILDEDKSTADQQSQGTAQVDAAQPGPVQPPTRDDDESSFLTEVGDVLEKEAELDSVQVARCRLIATALGNTDNDKQTLGVHDANLLYASRKRFRFSRREKSTLRSAGLNGFQHENVPLWTWSVPSDGAWHPLFVDTLLGPDETRAAAFKALTLLENLPILPPGFEHEDRDQMWFGAKVGADAKAAAASYLGAFGTIEDLPFIEEERLRNDGQTIQPTIEAEAKIRLRNDPVDAAAFLVRTSFDGLNEQVVRAALFSGLDAETLEVARDHRSSLVRLMAIQAQLSNGFLDVESATAALQDPAPTVRVAAVDALDRLGKPLALKDAVEAIKPLQQPASGASNVLGLGLGQFQATQLAEQYVTRIMQKSPVAELRRLIDSNDINREDAYFALVARSFDAQSTELRASADDRFHGYWEHDNDRIRTTLPEKFAEDLIARRASFADWARRSLTRKAFNVLAARGDASDLPRVRLALDQDAMELAPADIKFLERFGGNEDYRRIVDVVARSGIPSSEIVGAASRAIFKLAQTNLMDLLNSVDGPALKVRLIRDAQGAAFAALSDVEIRTLLTSELDSVRKAIALKMILHLPQRRVLSFAEAYVEPGQHRYYNVVFWLDLVAAYPIAEARKVAKRAGG